MHIIMAATVLTNLWWNETGFPNWGNVTIPPNMTVSVFSTDWNETSNVGFSSLKVQGVLNIIIDGHITMATNDLQVTGTLNIQKIRYLDFVFNLHALYITVFGSLFVIIDKHELNVPYILPTAPITFGATQIDIPHGDITTNFSGEAIITDGILTQTAMISQTDYQNSILYLTTPIEESFSSEAYVIPNIQPVRIHKASITIYGVLDMQSTYLIDSTVYVQEQSKAKITYCSLEGGGGISLRAYYSSIEMNVIHKTTAGPCVNIDTHAGSNVSRNFCASPRYYSGFYQNRLGCGFTDNLVFDGVYGFVVSTEALTNLLNDPYQGLWSNNKARFLHVGLQIGGILGPDGYYHSPGSYHDPYSIPIAVFTDYVGLYNNFGVVSYSAMIILRSFYLGGNSYAADLDGYAKLQDGVMSGYPEKLPFGILYPSTRSVIKISNLTANWFKNASCPKCDEPDSSYFQPSLFAVRNETFYKTPGLLSVSGLNMANTDTMMAWKPHSTYPSTSLFVFLEMTDTNLIYSPNRTWWSGCNAYLCQQNDNVYTCPRTATPALINITLDVLAKCSLSEPYNCFPLVAVPWGGPQIYQIPINITETPELELPSNMGWHFDFLGVRKKFTVNPIRVQDWVILSFTIPRNLEVTVTQRQFILPEKKLGSVTVCDSTCWVRIENTLYLNPQQPTEFRKAYDGTLLPQWDDSGDAPIDIEVACDGMGMNCLQGAPREVPVRDICAGTGITMETEAPDTSSPDTRAPITGVPATDTPITFPPPSSSSSLSSSLSIVVGLGAGLFVCAVLAAWYFWYFKRKYQGEDDSSQDNATEFLVNETHSTEMFALDQEQSLLHNEEWVVGPRLGKGAYGTVYKALLANTGSFIAVKVIPMSGETELARKEVDSMNNLSHPNIVPFYGSQVIGSQFCIKMEYMSGGSLGVLIKEKGNLSIERAKSFTQQITLGLEYLHGRQIVHRDVKGENVLIDGSGVIVKLTDFGCSKVLTQSRGGLTVVGTPRWMAPEVIMAVDDGSQYPADVWSLACTTCEMLTGEPPWPAFDTAYSAMYYIARHEPQIPATLDSGTRSFLEATLVKNPTSRPTCTDLVSHPWLLDSPLSSPAA
eukprot:TRINITY_DN3488_c0_g1_i1.p1 TRINITY_DN3488_c0_g1~~TRINITY_DN3488_c0_g1_i1.p1  ORF type:complete len:1131 (+),score=68.56 TRINITY_DN3488_c0_g1_i1:92-3394(+)